MLTNIEKNIRNIAREEIQREIEKQYENGWITQEAYRVYKDAVRHVKQKEDNMKH